MTNTSLTGANATNIAMVFSNATPPSLIKTPKSVIVPYNARKVRLDVPSDSCRPVMSPMRPFIPGIQSDSMNFFENIHISPDRGVSPPKVYPHTREFVMCGGSSAFRGTMPPFPVSARQQDPCSSSYSPSRDTRRSPAVIKPTTPPPNIESSRNNYQYGGTQPSKYSPSPPQAHGQQTVEPRKEDRERDNPYDLAIREARTQAAANNPEAFRRIAQAHAERERFLPGGLNAAMNILLQLQATSMEEQNAVNQQLMQWVNNVATKIGSGGGEVEDAEITMIITLMMTRITMQERQTMTSMIITMIMMMVIIIAVHNNNGSSSKGTNSPIKPEPDVEVEPEPEQEGPTPPSQPEAGKAKGEPEPEAENEAEPKAEVAATLSIKSQGPTPPPKDGDHTVPNPESIDGDIPLVEPVAATMTTMAIFAKNGATRMMEQTFYHLYTNILPMGCKLAPAHQLRNLTGINSAININDFMINAEHSSAATILASDDTPLAVFTFSGPRGVIGSKGLKRKVNKLNFPWDPGTNGLKGTPGDRGMRGWTVVSEEGVKGVGPPPRPDALDRGNWGFCVCGELGVNRAHSTNLPPLPNHSSNVLSSPFIAPIMTNIKINIICNS